MVNSRRLLLMTPIVWLLSSLSTGPLLACQCVGPLPPCQGLGYAEAVFVGEVLDIVLTTRKFGTSEVLGRRVRFRVLETLSGADRQTAEVGTGLGGGDCGYEFATNRRYLVYAHGTSDGGLETGICSRTKPLERADEDLKFFHSTPVGIRARVSGTVTLREGDTATGKGFRPFEGAQIVLTDGAQRYTTTSRADGTYSIDVPPGRYEPSAEVRSGFYSSVPFGPIVIRDPRACATLEIGVRYDGHVRGRVVTWTGTPVSHLPLEIGRAEIESATRYWSVVYAVTDETGAYDIRRVPPGRFLLAVPAVPRLLLPGTSEVVAAHKIEMTPSARIDLPDFVLPQSVRLVKIAGQVVDADGRPRAGASVYLKHPNETAWVPSIPLQTDSDGRFAFSAVEGQRYVLHAAGAPVVGSEGSEWINVTATAGVPPVALVLRAR